ncbi:MULTISPECIES: sodium:solute symporter family protein [Rhodococcus]|uniref:Na+/solute symporter n=1 Tax=Rhodococcus opacus RKJ300 = JCM 13270 TaxID=1165867 RepID=I0WAC4_RHOOP|nr:MULTISPECIES: sodium:solute symporter family protein [Rhodococcus]EID73340.1 Na+/solute symporter [Rhodococcus opacus RKJ300 = JCM 13270]QQZ13089.1 sodium:solute symporter family protein [Rhodococcus sp. 21391]
MTNSALWITLAGMIGLAVIAVGGRRKRAQNLSEWTVGKRNFGVVTSFFLQAGESFTTFTFLGVAGIAFTAGIGATYAIPYIPLGYVALYFIGPRIWKLSKDRGYITQADFFADRYGSPLLGRLVALCGIIFLLPYLQLQITGLGLIVRLVTGSASSGTLSMIVATVLVVGFVLWAGIHGLARTAYVKDVLILLAVVVLSIVIPLHFAGGIGDVFGQIAQTHSEMVTVNPGDYDKVWWTTSLLISAIGCGFLTTPHLWPPLLAAKNGRVIRSNNTFLPMYQVVMILPIMLGFVGILALNPNTSSNAVLLTLAGGALPNWALGLIAIAAASAAMLPAGAICIGISTLASHNLVKIESERTKLRFNHLVVIAAATMALVLGLTRPDLLANLLLLTFGGLSQLAPGLALALPEKPLLATQSVFAGLVVGMLTVIVMTVFELNLANIDAGICGLVLNLAVIAVVEAVVRATRPRTPAPASSEDLPATTPILETSK